MDEIQKVLVQSGRKDLAQKYYEKVAGRSVTPTYVVKYKDNDRKNRSDRTIEWKKEYGKPNLANLKKWRENMNKSYEKGGANYHITKSVGFIVRISDAEIVNQKTGDTIVKFKAPMFEASLDKIGGFIDEPKNKKLIADFTKNINEFQEMATDVKELLMKISNEARRQKLENFGDVEKLIKEIYKSVPEPFGFANKLMKLEKLLKQ